MSAVLRDSEKKRNLLAAYLRAQTAEQRKTDARIPPRPAGASIPLSFGQEQVWLHSQHRSAGILYNEPVTVHKRGALNEEALRRSLSALVARHEMWRTTFHMTGGSLFQRVHAPFDIEMPVADLRDLPPSAREQEAVRLATEDARQQFDLARLPLFRSRLVRFADDEHRLYITLHHLIFDGVSLYGIVLPELISQYRRFCEGDMTLLPPPAVQYGDFAVWQRREENIETFAGKLTYWKNQLADAKPLSLRSDFRLSPGKSFQGGRAALVLSEELSTALKNVARKHGATFYAVLLAAFQIILARYSGQEDVAIGSVTAGRKRSETEKTIGFFLNTIVVRNHVRRTESFLDLLRNVRRTVMEAACHDDVPFPYVVRELGLPIETGRNPFFNVMFSLEPPLDVPAPEWNLTQVEVDTGMTKFDLDLEGDARSDRTYLRLTYNAGLFSAGTAENMLLRYEALLRAVCEKPGSPVEDLAWWTSGTWAEPPRERLDERTVHQIFEQCALRFPDATALAFGAKQLTYRELNAKANQLARELAQRRRSPESPVGIALKRSPEMIVALLAVLKSGASYCALEFEGSISEMVVAKAGINTIIAEPAAFTHFPPGCEIVPPSLPDGADTANLDLPVAADQLACLCRTSGSTGGPKLIEIPHRAITSLMFGMDCVELDSTRVLLQAAPLWSDAALFEIWGALLHSGTLILAEHHLTETQRLGVTIRQARVTTLYLPTAAFHAIAGEAPLTLAPVNQVVIGGETLSVSHVRRAMEALPATTFINAYGPSETTTFACMYSIPLSLPSNSISIPIGRPVGTRAIHLLDKHFVPVPPGVVGEICIEGPGLARGYCGDPELTARSFVPHPLHPETRIYRSGDLGRCLSDGNFEYVGRRDHQVKVRGHRVDPAVIESVLCTCPVVRNAIVIPVPSEETGRLIAGIVLCDRAGVALEAVRHYAREHLSPHMIPSQFVALTAIPLLPNGKVDKAEAFSLLRNAATHSAPDSGEGQGSESRDNLAYTVLSIWQSLLSGVEADLHRSFFECGGDSLLAMKFVMRFERETGRILPVQMLLGAHTGAEITEMLERSV